VGDFNILLSSTDRLFGQEISKEPSELKWTIDQQTSTEYSS
jgi:hypothetical protein